MKKIFITFLTLTLSCGYMSYRLGETNKYGWHPDYMFLFWAVVLGIYTYGLLMILLFSKEDKND